MDPAPLRASAEGVPCDSAGQGESLSRLHLPWARLHQLDLGQDIWEQGNKARKPLGTQPVPSSIPYPPPTSWTLISVGRNQEQKKPK